ncbi:hypothetical protein VKT23_008560 [Stygiomarasmius scandens]|uniref:P-loop containing nucleoside triphosphate hydrolase protein n=1 Tax=Marasmiellus scandens TaxID=2682957 RepID=A0ABR1JM34_9AGAR
MSHPRLSSSDQVVNEKNRGFFSKKSTLKPASTDSADEKHPGDHLSVEAEVPPISFTQLFRYSTKFELLLDIVGLICAAAAGAAQASPLMTLLFGDLTLAFTNFSTALSEFQAGKISQAEYQATVDAFRSKASTDATYLVVLGCGMFICTYIYMYFWVYTGEVNAKRIRERYLKAVLRQDVAYFDKVGAGEVTTRIQTDTHLVQQGISEKVALVVNFLAAFLTGFILAYARNWRLALAISSILPCIAIAGGVMNRFVSRYMQTALRHVAESGTIAEEVISSIRTVQAFGTQHILSGLYGKRINEIEKVDHKAAVAHGAGLSVFFFVVYASYGLAFNFGTTLIIQGHADVGQVINVIMSILVGSFSLAMLAPEMQAITHGRGAAAKLFATIERVPDIDSADASGDKMEDVKGEITLERVKFSYPSRPGVVVVRDLSLNFAAGKTTALVGASGSGKSTIISLVERFYDPLEGVVKLDGRDLKTLNLKWLRIQIGLVSQEPVLFATTIKDNVAHGLIGTPSEHLSDEEKFKLIKEACIKSNADGFISKLPLGYDTMVGERGFLLSGGQKQRIAIARAVVSDPKILLLDEATSALDTQSEGIVQDALDKAAAGLLNKTIEGISIYTSSGRTTITIAHRLSTIKNADVIFVIGDGFVLEKGTHDELLNENGPYAKLVQSQKLREAERIEAEEEPSDEKNTEKQAADKIPLGRKNTSHSLASETLEQKQKETVRKEDYSLAYLLYRIGKMNREGWKKYAIGSVFAIMTGLVYPAYGIVFSKGVQGFTSNDLQRMRHDNDRVALWFFLIAITSMFSIGLQNFYFSSAAATVTARLRTLSFKAILRQDIEFFDQDENSTGALTSQLSDNPQKVNGLAGVTLGAIVQTASNLVAGTVVGLIFTWKIGLIALACTPLLVTTGYIRLRVVVLKDQANKKEHAASAQLACEAAGAIRTIASLTREDDCLDLYSKSLEEPLKKSNRTAIFSNGLYALSSSMAFFAIALVFWYGSRLVSSLEISTLRFFVGLMSATFGAIQAGNVFSFVPDVSSAKSAATDIIKLLDSIPEIDPESSSGKPVDPAKVLGQLRFDNVHFRYPTRPGVRVLRGLDMTIEPGTFIALVGQSGCGKSTVIQMIERFYDPLAGGIYLDGQNISNLNVSEYRKSVALVSQEPTLYAGTIRFNILLGAIKPKEEVTQEEIEDACRKANILDFIQSLPDGFDTEVGGKGSQLSGGQKQRIAIGRALLRNPKVLLLDEATSALDSNSERVVQEALDQASKGRTTIAIAHRLSSIQNADRIYFIKEGRIAEAGTHDQLLARRGDYYEFVQLQALSRGD